MKYYLRLVISKQENNFDRQKYCGEKTVAKTLRD